MFTATSSSDERGPMRVEGGVRGDAAAFFESRLYGDSGAVYNSLKSVEM